MNTIGITVYVDNDEKTIIEFGWLYRSWVQSESCDMSDLIVFHNPVVDMGKLPKHENIIYVPLVPLSERDVEWGYYKHINATWYMTTPAAQFISDYHYILKTDNDVFLTKHFKNLLPRLATFGTSGYATNPKVAHNLIRIAEKWGIKLHFLNVGCTVMAPSANVLAYASTQMQFAKRLKAEEFPDGKGAWPGWYLHVLNMYAGCLAANDTFGNSLTMGGLDVFCMSQDPICNTDYHIHAWHTDNHFSKLSWHRGEYDTADMTNLDPNKICDYCLLIAGKRNESATDRMVRGFDQEGLTRGSQYEIAEVGR